MSKGVKKPLAEVEELAKQIKWRLSPACDRIEIAGSIRRQRPMVGDIELVAIPGRDKNLLGETVLDGPHHIDLFFSERGVPLEKNGPKYKKFNYGPYSVDLYTPAAEWWGLRLVLSTGSLEFNIWLVGALKSRGFKMRGGRLIGAIHKDNPIPEEQDLFNLMEIPFIPPEMRQDNQWSEFLK